MRVHARELADVISAVKIADDEATREAIFRFRYSIYVDELRRGVGAVDVGDRSQRDPEDDEPNAVLIYTTVEDGSVNGTARTGACAPHAAPRELRSRFSIDGFPGLAEIGSAELGRVMLRRDRRGRSGLMSLVCAAYLVAAAELRSDVVFLTCLTGLVRHNRRIGFRTYAAQRVIAAIRTLQRRK